MSATICFISCNYFGFQALKGILASEEFKMKELTIPLIISLDQNKKYSTIGFYDFDKVAAQYKIETIRVDSIKSPEAVKIITTARPDYLFIVGWPELPPASILDIPKKINGSQIRNANTHGCIGMHPTLLPEGYGPEPIPWIILKDLRDTGITSYFLEEPAAAGGIIFQERIPIKKEETATTLFPKIGEAYYKQAQEMSPFLAGRLLHSVEQDLSRLSVWPKKIPGDGIIDFNEKADSINRLIRALTNPYPGAFFYYEGHKIIVNEIKIHLMEHSKPFGTIMGISANNLPSIAVKDGIIECLSISPVTGHTAFKRDIKVNG